MQDVRLKSLSLSLSFLALAFAATGCLTPEEGDLDVGDESSEIGEATCGTTTADATITLGIPGFQSRTTPTNYDNPQCRNMWVVDINQTSSASATAIIAANFAGVPTPTNQADCNSSSVRVITYAVAPGGSELVDDSRTAGQWYDGTCHAYNHLNNYGYNFGTTPIGNRWNFRRLAVRASNRNGKQNVSVVVAAGLPQ